MRKILIVVLDNLGDVVLATAVLRPLRRRFPDARFGVWKKSYAAGLFEGGDGVTVHAADPFWDAAPGRGKGAFSAFMGSLAEVSSEKYDCALLLNNEWRRAAACWWAGIPRRVGLRARKAGFFTTDSASGGGGHVIADHATVFAAFAGEAQGVEAFVPEIPVSETQRSEGRSWREALGWKDKKVVLLHAVTGDRLKNWPLERWGELVRRAPADWRFGVFCAPREEDSLREAFSGCPIDSYSLVNASIAGLKPMLTAGDLFLGGDSGPGHMAAALGLPVISLFGPTDPARYAPIGSKSPVILRENPLTGLSVERVREAAAKALSCA